MPPTICFWIFGTLTGAIRLRFWKKERRLRIETIRNSLPLYLFALHETTAAFHSGDWRMQLWADYNEFAMWCLLGMIASGFAMFLGARLRSRLAQISLAAGCCLFGVVYFFTRDKHYQKLRAIHLSTALFSLIFLLAFAIGAVEFAHRKWGAPGKHRRWGLASSRPESPTRGFWLGMARRIVIDRTVAGRAQISRDHFSGQSG